MIVKHIILDIFKIRYIENDDNVKWFIAKDICIILGVTNITSTLQNIKKDWTKRYKIKIKNGTGGIQNMILINLDAVKKILQNSRSINKDKILSSLKIDLDIIYDFKESSNLKIICASFKNLKQELQYQVNRYRIDLYFPEYKLAIEVDESGHKDRCPIYEKERQNYLEKYLGCTFIRFNPDEKNFNIGEVIFQILDKTILLKNAK